MSSSSSSAMSAQVGVPTPINYPEAFSSEAFDSLDQAQAQFNKDLLEFFPELPAQPAVEPTSLLDTQGEVTFGWAINGDGNGNIDAKALKEQQAVVRWAIEALKNDQARCEKVKKLRMLEYGWYQEEEMQGMKDIIRLSKNLETFQIAQNENTYNESYVPFIEPVWAALKADHPFLTTIVTDNGPVVPYQYQAFPNLTRLDMSSAEIEPADGSLPSGLKQLTLRFMGGFDTKWFQPSVFNTLEMLLLRDMTPEPIETITQAIDQFRSNPTQEGVRVRGALTHLSLDLFEDYHEAFFPAEQARPAFAALFNSFSPFFFPNLRDVEILSTVSSTQLPSFSELDPNPTIRLNNATIEEGLELVQKISNNWSIWPGLENLVIFFGSGQGFVTVEDYNSTIERMVTSLGRIDSLATISTNLIPASKGSLKPEDSAPYFVGIPSLKEVNFRGKFTKPVDSVGFKLVGRIGELRIEADGYRALLGEELPQDVMVKNLGEESESASSESKLEVVEEEEDIDAAVARLLQRSPDEL